MEQTNQNQFKCSGNCLNCLPAQRAYCASQHAYSNMKVLDMLAKSILEMQDQMNAMSGRVEDISSKIEAMQNNEANIFDPNHIAQEGAGALVEPQNNTIKN